MINNDESINGHTTKRNNIIKIQSYADDNTIIMKNPQELKNILKVYDKHAQASEAEINEEKTEILKLGNKTKHEEDSFNKKNKRQGANTRRNILP